MGGLGLKSIGEMEMTLDAIDTWVKFSNQVRSKGCNLLKQLDTYPNSILVTGCQRSGTTMLSRIIRESDGIVDYWSGKVDDELEGALILSGNLPHHPKGRYCFQTTYLNQCFHEYYGHGNGHKILWVLRNPFSTIYSLRYNWPKRALENTFRDSVSLSLGIKDKLLYSLAGDRLYDNLKKACLLYSWKLSQLFELYSKLGPLAIMVIDYDDLVMEKDKILPCVYDFIDLPYKTSYAGKIHTSSVDKKKLLTAKEMDIVKSHCEDSYLKAKNFIDKGWN
jgi:hypothetical protein